MANNPSELQPGSGKTTLIYENVPQYRVKHWWYQWFRVKGSFNIIIYHYLTRVATKDALVLPGTLRPIYDKLWAYMDVTFDLTVV